MKYLSLDIDLLNLVQPEVRYDFADADTDLVGCSLWDQRLFPHLCSVPPEKVQRATTFQKSVQHVLAMRHPTSLTFGRGDGALSFCGGTDPYDFELRGYLWLLFESIDRRFVRELRRPEVLHQLTRWPWRDFMVSLAATAPTTFVSFNYECFLETTLALGSIVKVQPDPNTVSQTEFPQQPHTCHVWKPHGCVSYYMPRGVYYGPCPWRTLPNQNVIVQDLRYSTRSAVRRVWPPRKMPALPDIVPPGECRSVIGDTMDYATEVQRVAHSADLLIFVGISGRPPDDAELKYMLRDIKSEAVVLHAGIGRDSESPLASLLRSVSRSYRYYGLNDDQAEIEFFQAIARQCLSPDEIEVLRNRVLPFQWRLVT